MVEKEEEDFVRRVSRCGLGVPRREIDLGMRCKANGLMPIGQALLGNRHRHNGAIATQQMQAPPPRKSETPAEQFARPTVSNLRADKPEKRDSDIAKGFFELFQHFLERIGAQRRTTNEVCPRGEHSESINKINKIRARGKAVTGGGSLVVGICSGGL